ncbi:MAG: 1-acyl-sn-glycerol-3-phosphate acyltransferase [Treponema sp.]|nr:1-acyl-sn-glycerol-3-phosphate acyltransferase [Treponema sp.]
METLLFVLKIIGFILLGLLCLEILWLLFFNCAALCASKKKEYEKDSKFYRFLLNRMTQHIFRIARIKVHVTGEELLPKDTRFCLVCNHRSKFDPISTWLAFRKYNLSFISKPENFSIPWFGRIIKRCLFMGINRENPRLALPTIEKSIRLLQKQEVSIAVYPEGTRSKDMKLHEFHNAIFKIPQRANVPLVVMTCQGAELIHKNFPFHHSDVYLDVLKIYSPEEINQLKTCEIGEQVTALMLEKLGE